jgi:hypothetical protein
MHSNISSYDPHGITNIGDERRGVRTWHTGAGAGTGACLLCNIRTKRIT